MNTLLYKLLPMILSLGLTQIIYLKTDERYKLTSKISSKLPMKQEWKAFFCFCCAMLIMLVIGVLGIYVIDIPATIYFILCGILTGIGVSISNKISVKKNE